MSEYKKNRKLIIKRTAERLREKGERTRDYSTNQAQKSRGNKYFKRASELERVAPTKPQGRTNSEEYLTNRAKLSGMVEKRLLDNQSRQRNREGSALNGRSGPVNQNLIKRSSDMAKIGNESREYIKAMNSKKSKYLNENLGKKGMMAERERSRRSSQYGTGGMGGGSGMIKDSRKLKK